MDIEKLKNSLEGITAKARVIMPDDAEKMLGDGILNRRTCPANLEYIKNEIELGDWIINGESIVFNTAGQCIDGKHRLLSCIETGKPITAVVVEGISQEAMITIDTGEKRNLGDMIRISGGSYCSRSAALTKLIHYAKKGTANSEAGRGRMPISKGFEVYSENLEEIELIGINYLFKQGFLKIPPSSVSYMAWILRRDDENNAFDYLQKICTGFDIDEGGIENQVRTWLFNESQRLVKPAGYRSKVMDFIIRGYLNKYKGASLEPVFMDVKTVSVIYKKYINNGVFEVSPGRLFGES